MWSSTSKIINIAKLSNWRPIMKYKSKTTINLAMAELQVQLIIEKHLSLFDVIFRMFSTQMKIYWNQLLTVVRKYGTEIITFNIVFIIWCLTLPSRFRVQKVNSSKLNITIVSHVFLSTHSEVCYIFSVFVGEAWERHSSHSIIWRHI